MGLYLRMVEKINEALLDELSSQLGLSVQQREGLRKAAEGFITRRGGGKMALSDESREISAYEVARVQKGEHALTFSDAVDWLGLVALGLFDHHS